MDRNRKASAFAAAAVTALALGTGWFHATHGTAGTAAHQTRAATDTDDKLRPANYILIGTAGTTTFSVPPSPPVITVTCTASEATSKTLPSGLGASQVLPPMFNNGLNSSTGQPNPCTDSTGGKDTTVTKGIWTITFLDSPTETETSAEPNTGDQLEITIPKGGAVVTNSLHCVITVAPTAAFQVIGAYDDVNKFTVSLSNLPVSVAGPSPCPTAATTSSFNGVYTFSPSMRDIS